MAEKIAIILIRSLSKVDNVVRDTLKMLRLSRKQHCSVYELTPSLAGMLNKVKDYVTYGVISEETFKAMADKKGEKDPKDDTKLKNLFRLNPPVGGYERKGIKVSYRAGGALGERDNMDALIQKMI